MMKYTLAALAVGLAACGGGSGDDDGLDAAPGADAGDSPDAGDECSVHETDDVANDAAGEETGLTLGGGIRICGQMDAREPDGEDVVDLDLYTFEIPDAGPILIRVVADGDVVASID